MVAGLCRLLVRDRTEAEDAAQQTFLSADRALLRGSVPREPAPWLAAIARNECRARARARMREPLLLGDAEPSTTAPDALSEAIHRADLVALRHAIDALPVPQREALLLREFGGLSYDELAAALAVSSSAVESLLFRARRSLRDRLGEAYAEVAAGLAVAGSKLSGACSRVAPVPRRHSPPRRSPSGWEPPSSRAAQPSRPTARAPRSVRDRLRRNRLPPVGRSTGHPSPTSRRRHSLRARRALRAGARGAAGRAVVFSSAGRPGCCRRTAGPGTPTRIHRSLAVKTVHRPASSARTLGGGLGPLWSRA